MSQKRKKRIKSPKTQTLKSFVTSDEAPVVENSSLSTEIRKISSKIESLYESSIPSPDSQLNLRRNFKVSDLSEEDIEDVLSLIQDAVDKRKKTANPARAFKSTIKTDTENNVSQEPDLDPAPGIDLDTDEMLSQAANRIVPPRSARGVSRFRPEVLAVTDYERMTSGSPAREMIDLQINSRYVRAENMQELLGELTQDPESSSSKQVDALKDRFNGNIDLVKDQIQFLKDFFENRFLVSEALGINSSPEAILEESQKLRDARLGKSEFLAGKEIFAESKSVREFLVQDLGFSAENAQDKTGTTCLMQILQDLRTRSTQTYVNQDVNLEDRFRARDIYAVFNRGISTFNKELLPVIKNKKVPLSTADLYAFRNKRPSSYRSPGDLAKATAYFLSFMSRELNVSSALGNTAVQEALANQFGATQNFGDPFDNILGKTSLSPNGKGSSIALSTSGDQSVLSLSKQNDGNSTVYPFEIKPVSTSGRKNKRSGKSFYVDSITTNKDVQFDTQALNSFAGSFGNRCSDAYQLLDTLLALDGSGIFAEEILSEILSGLHQSIENLNPTDSVETLDKQSALELAILFHSQGYEGSENTYAAFLQQILLLMAMKRAATGGTQSVLLAELLENERETILRYLQSAAHTESSADFRAESDPAFLSFEALFSAEVSKLILREFPYAENIYDPGSETTDDQWQMRLRYSYGEMSSYLRISMRNESSIFSQVLNVIEKVDAKIREKGNPIRENGGTRFKNVSVSSLIAMVTTIMGMMINKMAPVRFNSVLGVKSSFSGTPSSSRVYVHIDKSDILSLRDSLRGFVQGGIDEVPGGSQLAMFLGAIESRFDEDLEITLNSTEILNSIGINLTSRVGGFERFIDPQGANSLILGELDSEIDSRQKLTMIDRSQLALAINQLEDYLQVRTEDNPEFFATDLIDKSTRAALIKFGTATRRRFDSRPEVFLGDYRANNLKLISVGIPAGLTAAIQPPGELRRSPKQSDLVDINVYMRSLDYDGLVFHPQGFSFEMSRFFKKVETIPGVKQDDERFSGVPSFDSIIQSFIVTRDIEVGRSPVVLDTKGYDVQNLEEYGGTSRLPYLREIIQNTAFSHFANLYLKLCTGIDFSEPSFLFDIEQEEVGVDSEDLNLFTSLVQGHVSSIAPGQTLDGLADKNPQLKEVVERVKSGKKTKGVLDVLKTEVGALSRDNNVRLSEDLVSFSKMVSPNSIVTSPTILKKKALTPKVFERVFTMLVDPDQFLIDGTRSDRRQISSLLRRGIIVRATNIAGRSTYKFNYGNRAFMNEFFCSVERSDV